MVRTSERSKHQNGTTPNETQNGFKFRTERKREREQWENCLCGIVEKQRLSVFLVWKFIFSSFLPFSKCPCNATFLQDVLCVDLFYFVCIVFGLVNVYTPVMKSHLNLLCNYNNYQLHNN
jgi:hypothetical protein